MAHKMTTCKACGKEIAKSAKFCPSCGAKNKKPIFKRWWFWVIVLLLLGSVGNAGNETDRSNAETSGTQIESTPIVDTQSVETPPIADTQPLETTPAETEAQMTTEQKNALRSAKSYLAFTAFSYEGLIDQLEFEQYAHEDAVFAADNCGADWNEQALKAAENYLDYSAFSYKGLITQLEFEKYTTEQATYAVDNCGADWFEQAAKCAENYLDFSSFSKSGLIEQLEFEGFTKEQAEYGAKTNGFE